MFKDVKDTLKILKSGEVIDEKLVAPKGHGMLEDLYRRTSIVTDGRVPDMTRDITDIIKILTEMAVREAPEGAQEAENRTYFGSSGERQYYADIAMVEAAAVPAMGEVPPGGTAEPTNPAAGSDAIPASGPTGAPAAGQPGVEPALEEQAPMIKSIHIYDIADDEVWALDNAESLPSAEVIYQAVVALSLDSIAWKLLADLELIKLPEEKPEEPIEPEKAAGEETPPEGEETEEEEPVESVQTGDVISVLMDLAGPAILKAGVRGIVGTIESVDKISVAFKLDETSSITRIFKLEEIKKSFKKIVKKKKIKEDINKPGEGQESETPKKSPAVKTDNQSPAKGGTPEPGNAADTPDAPVVQKEGSLGSDKEVTDADPNLKKDNVANTGDIKLEDQNPEKVKQSGGSYQTADGGDPNLTGSNVKKVGSTDKIGEAAVTEGEAKVLAPSLDKDAKFVHAGTVPLDQSVKPSEPKQDLSAVAAGQDNLKKEDPNLEKSNAIAVGGDIKLESLEVQPPEEYKNALDALQKDLEAGKITQADFENGKSELDKKFKAKPAGTTEAVVEAAVEKAVNEATIEVGNTVKVKGKDGLFKVTAIKEGKATVEPLSV